MSDELERPGLFGRKDDVRLRASYLLKTELRKARSVEEGSGAGVGWKRRRMIPHLGRSSPQKGLR